ncbi:hypothetical protein P154DRAFT_528148 [Amniculicola lignicola CBS 123094]|uniref:DNA damage-binding protein 1 n=1 Tax=Amniculicola lignicola CBS 123094 TaxID=1392246 RepID=A0A6A5VVN7_9PLEO|nr:hypothetical protein P154DRAFT_528148 [Amniculicola lignicola CBS 123094]
MAYIVPIHRPSSIRHALKLNFLAADEECLVVAKANRLEFYTQKPDGLALQHSQALYGRVTMLQKLRPALAPTDHLFVGTDRFMYFTLSWNREKKQTQTEKTFESVADNTARESQTGERCQVDPSGRFMTLEVYEGIVTVIPLVQRGKKRKQESEIALMGDPVPQRVPEMFVRSSAFLRTRSANEKPQLALLYEDTHSRVRLKLRSLGFNSDNTAELDDGELYAGELDIGASHLIPVEAPIYGALVVGETSVGYYDVDTKKLVTVPLEEATIFVAWASVDKQRFVFADDYGRLFLFVLDLDDKDKVTSWSLHEIGQTSRASTLVYLDAGCIFVGSHQGNSQVVKITGEKSLEVIQTFQNIAPILDFTIMDMGNRSGEGQTNEYSSGQARLVTGSGAYQDGSLRSVRSGVGLEEYGILGEMDSISNLFSLKSDPSSPYADTILVSLVDESRVFRFDNQGEVEETDQLAGLDLAESTLYAANISQGRILQITNSRVQITDIEGGMTISEWTPPGGHSITAASANDTHILLSLGRGTVVALGIEGLSLIKEKTYSAKRQISCIALPPKSSTVCFLGFWENSNVSVCSIDSLDVINSTEVSTDSVPQSLLLTQIFPDQPPTLFVALADGNVVTFSFNATTNILSGKKSIILGTRQPTLRALPRGDGLFSVFATCENPSLIYGSEGRLVYSAVTAEKATTVAPFDTEAYPGSVVMATSEDLRLAHVDPERSTHVQTLPVHETVRRIAYSPALKAFGLGTIRRVLKAGEELLISHFKLVDEIQFRELDTYRLNSDELIECVMRCSLPDGPDSNDRSERFVIGTAYLDDDNAMAHRGRVIVLEVTEDRKLKVVTELAVKGGCRCLAMCDGNIVAALIKTVVIYNLEYRSESTPELVKVATFRCSTAPIDVVVNGSLITIADLMKSLVILQYSKGEAGLPDKLAEVARHYQTTWATAVAEVDENTYLESDAEGNLVVLTRDLNSFSEDDRKRLVMSSEMQLGEMVNRIRRIDVQTASDPIVIPRAFLATVRTLPTLSCLTKRF